MRCSAWWVLVHTVCLCLSVCLCYMVYTGKRELVGSTYTILGLQSTLLTLPHVFIIAHECSFCPYTYNRNRTILFTPRDSNTCALCLSSPKLALPWAPSGTGGRIVRNFHTNMQ